MLLVLLAALVGGCEGEEPRPTAPPTPAPKADVDPTLSKTEEPATEPIAAPDVEPEAPALTETERFAADLKRLCGLAVGSTGKGLDRRGRMVWIGERFRDTATRKGWGLLQLIATSPSDQGCLMLRAAGGQADLGERWSCAALCPMVDRFDEVLLADVRLLSSTSDVAASTTAKPVIIGEKAMRTHSLDLVPVSEGRVDDVFKSEGVIRALKSTARARGEGETLQLIADVSTRAVLIHETLRTGVQSNYETFELLLQGGGGLVTHDEAVQAWSIGDAVSLPLRWREAVEPSPDPWVRLVIRDDGFLLTSWAADGTQTHHTAGDCNDASALYLVNAEGGPEYIEVPMEPERVCSRDASAKHPRDRYDWVALYNALLQIKGTPDFTAVEGIEVVAMDDITLDILVATLDLVRQQRSTSPDALEGAAMADHAELIGASPALATLFPEPVLSTFEGSVASRPLQPLGEAAIPEEYGHAETDAERKRRMLREIGGVGILKTLGEGSGEALMGGSLIGGPASGEAFDSLFEEGGGGGLDGSLGGMGGGGMGLGGVGRGGGFGEIDTGGGKRK